MRWYSTYALRHASIAAAASSVVLVVVTRKTQEMEVAVLEASAWYLLLMNK